MKIYKYDLHYHSVPEIVRLPKNTEIVDFGIQEKSFKLWALVDPEAEKEERVFVLVMTGQDIPWNVKQTFGTRVVEESGIVVHLLELLDVEKGTGPLSANDPQEDERLKTN